jgi:glutathione synthase/RimK-type ligase-like ATP-grasp enzyme
VILIVTSRPDYTADWLILELARQEVPFVRFNTEDYPTATHLQWTDGGAASLRLGGHVVDLADVHAVWYRRPTPPILSSDLSGGRAVWAAAESREALDGLWRTLDARWVNHPDHNRLADCKPEQLRRASELGFAVPKSLITNEPGLARDFVTDHPDGVVCKPLFSGRVELEDGAHLFFTTLLDQAAVADLQELGPEPYLFQALVPKRYDVRVTVIGDEAFAARIDSQPHAASEVDWRRGDVAELSHRVEDLPTGIADLCVQLVKSYGLLFGAIDLAQTADGYVFFEINPNGQWAWLEQRTDLRLRDRLVDLLVAS